MGEWAYLSRVRFVEVQLKFRFLILSPTSSLFFKASCSNILKNNYFASKFLNRILSNLLQNKFLKIKIGIKDDQMIFLIKAPNVNEQKAYFMHNH